MTKDSMKKAIVFSLALLLVVLPLSGVSSAKEVKRISAASKPAGAYYYNLTAGLANLIKKYEGIDVTVETFASPFAYMPLLGRGDIEFCLGVYVDAYQAYHGLNPFKEKSALAALANGHEAQFCFWALPNRGINSIKDFEGKRLAWINPVSTTTTQTAEYMLEMTGMKDKVITIERPKSFAATVDLLKEKRIDGFAGPPGSRLKDVVATYGSVVAIGVSKEVANAVSEKYPYYYGSAVPAGMFKGVDKDVPCIATGNLLIAHSGISNDLAYRIVKSLYDHVDEFSKVHAYGKRWTLDRAVFKVPIPYHPGAIKYFKEKNIWSKEAQLIQDNLLKQKQ